MYAAMLSPVHHILRAIATTVIPEAASLDEHAWVELEGVVASALAARDRGVQRQFVVFLRVVQWLPVLRHGRRFTALPPHRRLATLARLERSWLLSVRRGMWGVRTLLLMGYYTRAEVCEAIGYRPHATGWEARGGTVATVPLAPALWVEP